MKVKTLALVAGLGAPLILTNAPDAGFVGIKVVSKPSINPNRLICNIYAEFDRPGEDHMNIVGGGLPGPLQIDVIGGQFFNPGFANGDLAPSPDDVAANPDAAEDSFVTVGVKLFNSVSPGVGGGQPTNNTGLVAGWPGFGISKLFVSGSGWFVTPNDPQGDPFNPNYVAGNGQILLAQFTAVDNDGDGFVAISGTMAVQVVSNGQTVNLPVSFFHGCPWDCEQTPDNFVGITDLFELFGQWTMVGTSCDFDGGGAGITDLFEMFGNWGPCP